MKRRSTLVEARMKDKLISPSKKELQLALDRLAKLEERMGNGWNVPSESDWGVCRRAAATLLEIYKEQ